MKYAGGTTFNIIFSTLNNGDDNANTFSYINGLYV